MRIVLLGAPGCGKGTQGHRLAKHYGIPEVATGDLLRQAVAAGTPLGKAAKAAMDAGQLVSDEIVLGVIRQRLGEADALEGFILDGFPRNLAQAEQLDELLDQLGQPLDLAIVIDVDVDLILQRLLGRRTCVSCGASYNVFSAPPRIDDSCDECGGRLRRRADDNEETIGNRLRIYELQTVPVTRRYRDQGRLRVVQGIGEIGDVFTAVTKAIEEARPGFEDSRAAAIRRAVARTQAPHPDGAAEVPAEPVAETASGRTAADSQAAGVQAAASPAKKPVPGKDAGAGRTPAGTTAAKKAAAKPAVGKKPAVVKKKVAKQAADKKKAVHKETAARSRAANKAVVKSAAVKKPAVAKKPATGTAVGKRTPARSRVAKKAAVKSAVVKKPAAVKKPAVTKKQAAKKTVGKQTPARNKVVKNAAAKPAAGKKPVVVKKPTAAKKKVPKKTAAGAGATKQQPAGRKSASPNKAAARKTAGVKKKVVAKPPVGKRTVTKKAVRKR
jgi:adenylate kinase